MAKPTIKVVEKNEGRKIGYELEGSTLWIGDAIAMRLPRLQTDDTVKKRHLRRCRRQFSFWIGRKLRCTG